MLENVEEAVARDQGQARPLQRRSPRSWPTPTPTTTRCSPRWATCRPTSTTPTRGTSTAGSTRRWTRCAARRRTRWSTTSPVASGAGSRCASCCSSSPTCCCSTSPPTTSTPSRCSGSRATSRPTPARSWPSPTTGTSSTTWPSWILELDRGQAHPYEGNYSTYLETKKERLKVEGAEGRQARQDARARAGVGALQPQGPAGQEQVPPGALRGDGGRGRAQPQDRHRRDQHPGRVRASATSCSRPTSLAKGFGDRTLMHDLSLHPAARRHRRRDRPQRRRQDHAVPDDHRRGEARRRASSRSARR